MRALLIVLFASNEAIAGPCAIEPLHPHAKTVNGTEIPPDGGILVGLMETRAWDQPSITDLTKTDWKFVDGGKSTAPSVTLLAPGLARFTPPAGTGAIRLDDAKRTVVTAKRSAAQPLLVAPVAVSVGHRVARAGNRHNPDIRSVVVALAGPRPDGAVALILYKAAKPPIAASWVSAFGYQAPRGDLEIYHSPYRCETPIPGMIETGVGTRVTLAWVDAAGRVGAHSKELVVGRAKPEP